MSLEEADAEVARIMAMSDEELLAEARANGEDPEAIAAAMRDMVAEMIATHSPPPSRRTQKEER